MKKLIGLLCTFIFLGGLSLRAATQDELPLGAIDFSGAMTPLEVSKTSLDLTSIRLANPTIVVQEVTENFETYQAFGMVGESFVMAEGSPSVPQISRLYRIPNTGSATLEIRNDDYELVENVNALPYQRTDRGFEKVRKNEAVYARDEWYPANVAEISEPMIMRDFRVVQVILHPVQVNPVTHQARIYRNLEVNIASNDTPGANELTNVRQPSGEWASIYRNMIQNLDENALDDMTRTPGSLLILTSSNAIPRQWADSLAMWKTRKGFKVTVDARSNWSAQTAITAIRTAYSNPDRSVPPLEFVVLMGDPGASWGMPLDNTNQSFDHSYALGNTGDDLEDIAVGRISASTASSLATVNAKIMGYERTPHLESSPGVADTMWFHKAFLYAGVGRGCADNGLCMRWGRQQFINNTAVDSVELDTHSGDGVNTSVIQSHLNAGVSFFIWRGSWIGGMPTGVPSGLQSSWRLPICMTVTCEAGTYSGNGVDSPAEAFLCEGTPTNPKGGVCGIGTSTSGTENGANVILASGLLYNIADLLVEHLGTAVAGAKNQLFYSYPAGWPDPEGYPQGIAAKFTRLFNLLGDPSLSMWTDVPKVLTVTHPQTLNVGARSVEVTVTREADGVPVQDAVVCLWKRGTDSTWVRGLTDANGRITLPVNVNLAGNLDLTVTKHNHKPYLFTIPCNAADQMVTASSYQLIDNGSNGTIGNGDGQLNPGETIDVRTYLKNFGTAQSGTNVSAVLSSANPHITVSTANNSYPNIAPGDSAAGTSNFRIVVSPSMQNYETALLTVSANASSIPTISNFQLNCRAGELRFVSSSFSAPMNPGDTRTLSVTLNNVGVLNLANISAQLISLDPYVSVTDINGTFGNINTGANGNNNGDQFTLHAHPEAFRGRVSTMLLVANSNGFIDSVQFTVTCGNIVSSDPTGPDAFGYYAYDNTDVNYQVAPTFSYVDISATGQNLNISDSGDKTSLTPVWSAVRRLPFGFKFYGQVYDSITVCSNGWCAFGNQSWYDGFRNFQIPAMRAPDAMIAPYWDDLVTAGNGHGVWVKNDSLNHRYIIQWKATANHPANLDFEVILYDTTFTPTFSGNGDVVIQYNHVTMNIQPQYGDDAPGSTIGIQKPGNTVGLQYAYISTYAPGSATVQDGRAILFSTDAVLLLGDIEGHVYDAETNLPLANVLVSVDGNSYHDSTDSQGHYFIEGVFIGNYTVRAHLASYNDLTVSNVIVEQDSVETVDFHITHPEFALSADSLVVVFPAQPAQGIFNVINGGNGPLDYSISLAYAGNPSNTQWAQLSQINVSQHNGDMQILGCEFVGDAWWVSGGNSEGGQNQLYRYDLDGNFINSIPQPSTTALGWFDMAYDGTTLYGSDSPFITGINPATGQVVTTIPSPLNPTRAIAYNPANDHFFVADYSSDIYELDRAGNIIQQITNEGNSELNITGLAWYAADADGFKLYIFSQNGSNTSTLLTKMNTVSHTTQVVTTITGNNGDRAGGCTITPNWNNTLLVFGGIMQNSAGDRLGIYQMAFDQSWISVNPSSGSVPGGQMTPVTMSFDTSTLRNHFTYRLLATVHSNIVNQTLILPVSFRVDFTDAADEHNSSLLPQEYSLYQNYPNPFNPTTTIRYDLKSAGQTKLSIYNTLGQQVATLVDEVQAAGSYSIHFDASVLGSGVYFYRLESGNFTQVNKMMLMK